MGAKVIQSPLFFPPGIWIGADCVDAGNSDALMNTLNPSLHVLPGLTYSGKSISIKGSITMNEDYQFTACDFCMHPDSRIVSKANTLSFLSGARQQSAIAIQQMLNSVSPAAQWETNEKSLNEIYLLTSFVDQMPDSAQQVQIQQIAEQCIADGGPAVTRARAWYFVLTGTRIEVNCGGVIERSATMHKEPRIVMRVSPNPARNSMLVQFSEITKVGSRLDIYDLAGNLKKSITVPEGVQDISVQIANLSIGFYACRLVQDERVAATVKFTILH